MNKLIIISALAIVLGAMLVSCADPISRIRGAVSSAENTISSDMSSMQNSIRQNMPSIPGLDSIRKEMQSLESDLSSMVNQIPGVKGGRQMVDRLRSIISRMMSMPSIPSMQSLTHRMPSI